MSKQIVYAFILSTFITFMLASVAHTQFVLFRLSELGIDISLWDRLRTTAQDMAGMLPKYGAAVAAGLLIAFWVTTVLRRKGIITHSLWFAVAGGVAMMSILLAMHPYIDAHLLVGARGPLGFAAQCAAGVAGGWVFGRLSR
ncbi:hypothetical protein [Aestuariibacter salexigens]|uniref:hypothetical protein n=1 Tax=Aestuariibacter salexigens TaxID=226010 RepID=UPI00041C83FC|nr:hypothetical protein [Aestuariibacter salexigens]